MTAALAWDDASYLGLNGLKCPVCLSPELKLTRNLTYLVNQKGTAYVNFPGSSLGDGYRLKDVQKIFPRLPAEHGGTILLFECGYCGKQSEMHVVNDGKCSYLGWHETESSGKI